MIRAGLVSFLLFPEVAVAQSTPPPNEVARDQDSDEPQNPEWQYGAFTDVGYLRDFNHPHNKVFRSRGTAWHLDAWHLNIAGAYARKATSEQSRWGAEFTVQAGKDSELFGFSATVPNIAGYKWMRHLGPVNASYLAALGNGLTLQAGIFTSLIGYDSLYAKDNFNYTRPWGADFTPYLMMGVNASYPFTNKLTGTFFVVNGYWHLANANSVPSSGGQLAYKASARLMFKETVLWGPHQSNTSLQFWRFLSDSILEHRTDRLVAALNCHFSTERVDTPQEFRAWWVAAQIPIRWVVGGPFSVSVRPELAWDSKGRWTLAEQEVKAFTTTLEYRFSHHPGATIIRVEHRFDDSRGRQGGFFNDGETTPGVMGLKPTQHLLIIGLIFTFNSSAQR